MAKKSVTARGAPASPARRRLLERLVLGAAALPLAEGVWRAAPAQPAATLLAVDAPEAKAVHYVEDAKDAPGATPGSRCGNCGLYQGASGTTQGPCQLFPGKEVKEAGWCSSWAPQI
jgi:hypothetical protein